MGRQRHLSLAVLAAMLGVLPQARGASPQASDQKIKTSLASPERPSEDFPLPDEWSAAHEQGWSTLSGDRFRPAFGLQWFHLDTEPKNGVRSRPSWLGLRAQGEAVIFQSSYFESGVGAHYFNSMAGFSEASTDTTVTELSAFAYIVLIPEPSAFGLVQLRLFGGFFGNWREGAAFVGPQKGPQAGVSLSTGFDEAIRIGVTSSYVFTPAGVLEIGGYLSHRMFSVSRYPWDARFAITRSAVGSGKPGSHVQESWSSLQIGLTGSI